MVVFERQLIPSGSQQHQGRILGGLWGPGPPGSPEGRQKERKKRKGKERERGEKKKKEEKEGNKKEKREERGSKKEK